MITVKQFVSLALALPVVACVADLAIETPGDRERKAARIQQEAEIRKPENLVPMACFMPVKEQLHDP